MRVTSPFGVDSYKPGDYYILCDRCGFKIRQSESKKTWDNLVVCKKDWEPRHPQDLIKPVREQQIVPFARSEPADRFLSDNEISPDSL